jgi:hypothetical protein
VARIQARQPGAAAGQVTFADAVAAAGRLSLATDRDAGNVALTPETPGPGR